LLAHGLLGWRGARQELEQQLARHARQHEAVARLGQIALREHDLRRLFDDVVETVARVLDVQLCAVLKLREGEERLDIVSSVGYREVPDGSLPGGRGTQAGFALIEREPVVAEDLHSETRFDTSSLLAQGMLSGINAVIEAHGGPFGVLTAHSSRRRRFSTDDVNFLVAVANVLSAAVERQRKDEASRHAALHDLLTGLPNRTLVLDRVDLALARGLREGTEVAVLMLDLDRFKIINDSLGHDAGDGVLLAVATRLNDAVRASDTVARLSGDEFVVVCERAGGVRHVVELAERLRAAVSRPFTLDGGEHVLTASIGIALAEGRQDTAAALLRDADAAMYRAKQLGPGRYELFDATVRAQVIARLRTETELRHAIEHGQLRVHYQPILEAAGGRPVAMEALVRWQHPSRGLIGPCEFIPIAEETGLITELGRHVLEVACSQGAEWQRLLDSPLQIFVNVSAAQIANPMFAGEVAEIAKRSGLRPRTLGIEVTESLLIEETGSSTTVIGSLRAHGLRLVLDDFGTGYSSLSYLRRFPLDSVKVDRSFIDGLGSNAQDATIMKAIVEMCHVLGLTVVAEGVESQAQLDQVRRLGCEQVQGYLLSQPLAAAEASAFLRACTSDGSARLAGEASAAQTAGELARPLVPSTLGDSREGLLGRGAVTGARRPRSQGRRAGRRG
jgi:diguanylate cyclase (GGDEF)-like protein